MVALQNQSDLETVANLGAERFDAKTEYEILYCSPIIYSNPNEDAEYIVNFMKKVFDYILSGET